MPPTRRSTKAHVARPTHAQKEAAEKQDDLAQLLLTTKEHKALMNALIGMGPYGWELTQISLFIELVVESRTKKSPWSDGMTFVKWLCRYRVLYPQVALGPHGDTLIVRKQTVRRSARLSSSSTSSSSADPAPTVFHQAAKYLGLSQLPGLAIGPLPLRNCSPPAEAAVPSSPPPISPNLDTESTVDECSESENGEQENGDNNVASPTAARLRRAVCENKKKRPRTRMSPQTNPTNVTTEKDETFGKSPEFLLTWHIWQARELVEIHKRPLRLAVFILDEAAEKALSLGQFELSVLLQEEADFQRVLMNGLKGREKVKEFYPGGTYKSTENCIDWSGEPIYVLRPRPFDYYLGYMREFEMHQNSLDEARARGEKYLGA